LILATREEFGMNYFQPLGLGYMKSYLKKYLPDLDVIICSSFDELLKSKPDCVGISASTENYAIAQQMIKRVKEELQCPVLLGGVHISLLPESLPVGVLGCIGEGEETLVELMKTLKAYGFNDESLSRVKGIVYWNENGQLVKTPARDLIMPLDSLPFPDRDALGIKPGIENLYIFTSRGCPYTCKFCVSRIHWNKYREFSAEYVLNEIEYLIDKYKINKVTVFDDLFIVNRKRLREFVNGYVNRKMKIEMFCAVRANLVDEELAELLKTINIKEVTFGAESFSEPVLKVLKCGSVTAAQNQKAIDILAKNGIKVNCSIIFDTPEQSEEDMIITWRAIFNNVRENKLNRIGWGLLRPYPGCDYWYMAVERGLASDNMDWELFRDLTKLRINDKMSLARVNEIIEEWDTKCCLVNLKYRDAPVAHKTKDALIVKKEETIKKICGRPDKDESDKFVAGEYENFLDKSKKYKVILVDGWEPSSGEDFRWIRKKATLFINSSIRDEANLLNLIFYVQDINYYQEPLVVKMKLGNEENSIAIANSGIHCLTMPLPYLAKLSPSGFLHMEISTNVHFIPARVSSSIDDRNLSIVVSRLELAKNDPANIINVIKLPQD
jgi:radical SAM superfamily enzyme YgiQ (UPF0313 family)